MTISVKPIIEVWNGTTTTYDDISKDVVSEITCSYGIRGNNVMVDRVSSVGEMKFTLRNDATCIGGVENYYTPNTLNTKTEWHKGVAIRLKLQYRTETVYKFVGHVSDIKIDLENKRVDVTCSDWMENASHYPVKLLAYTENKRIEEVVALILSGMSSNNQPDNTSYATGTNTFTSVFDTVKNSTRAIGEFQKLAVSEMGYIFLRCDPIDGETLVVGSRYSHSGNDSLVKLPKLDNNLACETTDLLVTESGATLVLDETQDASFTNKANGVNFTYGDRIFNKVTAKYYPRKVDTTTQVLFSLDSPLYIASGDTATIEGNYRDPDSQANTVAGKNMVTPVATTDYQMFTGSDGTGTNLTSSLVVTATYLASRVQYTLKNNSASNGYVTKLQARGYGIYLYNPLDYVATDNLSIDDYGEQEYTLDLKYLNSQTMAKYYADNALYAYCYPKPVVESFSFLGNTEELMLLGFMYLDIGDFVYIKDDKSDITEEFFYHYINGIDFTIDLGGIVHFNWIIQKGYNNFD